MDSHRVRPCDAKLSGNRGFPCIVEQTTAHCWFQHRWLEVSSALPILHVSVSEGAACVLTESGMARCHMLDAFGNFVSERSWDGVRSISGSSNRNCIATRRGIVCIGRPMCGGIGPTHGEQWIYHGSDIDSILVTDSSVYAKSMSGVVWGWGRNIGRRINPGVSAEVCVNHLMVYERCSAFADAESYSCCLDHGEVRCRGRGFWQSGPDAVEGAASFEWASRVDRGVRSIASSDESVCVVDQRGEVRCWGSITPMRSELAGIDLTVEVDRIQLHRGGLCVSGAGNIRCLGADPLRGSVPDRPLDIWIDFPRWTAATTPSTGR